MKKLFLNQKCYLNKDELYNFILKMRPFFKYSPNLVIFPSIPFLSILRKEQVLLGSQNISGSDKFNQTGETTGSALRSLGVEYTLIGHSERRSHGETNEDTNAKIRMALSSNIIPVLCIGETKEENEQGLTYSVIKKQLFDALHEVRINKLITAYEPLWAIGTNITPKNAEINRIYDYIRSLYKELGIYGDILYGGSVSSKNIDVLKDTEVDGFLIGGSSSKPDEMEAIIRSVTK